MTEAMFLVLNEVVVVAAMNRDHFGVTMVTIKHFDGRISVVKRSDLLFDEDERQLRELVDIIRSSKNPARNRRYFELFKELVKREAPISLLRKYIAEHKTRRHTIAIVF